MQNIFSMDSDGGSCLKPVKDEEKLNHPCINLPGKIQVQKLGVSSSYTLGVDLPPSQDAGSWQMSRFVAWDPLL